jgi:hypothetical protein
VGGQLLVLQFGMLSAEISWSPGLRVLCLTGTRPLVVVGIGVMSAGLNLWC